MRAAGLAVTVALIAALGVYAVLAWRAIALAFELAGWR